MTAFVLSKMVAGEEDFSVRLIDGDIVGDVNIRPSLYTPVDIGICKVLALQRLLLYLSNLSTTVCSEFVGPDNYPSLKDIVVVSVDTMAVRKDIWENCIGLYNPHWLIDARMGAEICTIVTVDLSSDEQRERYDDELFTDDEARQLPCTARAIAYNTAYIAALIVRTIKRILVGEEVDYQVDSSLKNLVMLLT